MALALEERTLEAIRAHAREAYPEECCGLVIVREGRERAVRASNLQNELHREDPEHFPRSAARAYTMGPEAAPWLIASERGEARLLAIYHSHPDRGAYFSAEDRAQACTALGEPVYPQAAQIVISVRNGEVRDMKAFRWDPRASDYVEERIGSS